MRSFFCKNKAPICKWGMLPENTYFEGKVPEGYQLAINPSGNYIVIDVDVNEEKGKDGFKHIPIELLEELYSTLNYKTKRNGRHFWFKYTGNKPLGNKTSGLDIDLRTKNGYAIWYREGDIRDCLHLIKETSNEMNLWLEKLFSYVD